MIDSPGSHTFAWLDEVFVAIWSGTQPNEEDAGRMHEYIREHAYTEFPRVGVLSILSEGTPVPDSNTRAELGRALQGHSRLAASAAVLEGEGLRVTAHRKLAAGFGFLAGPPFPHRIFSSSSEGVGWLTETIVYDHPIEFHERLSDCVRYLYGLKRTDEHLAVAA